MGAKQGVGRPRKNTLRVELRLNMDDVMVKILIQEAETRGVPLQQYIVDLLTARFLGQPIQPEAPAKPDQNSAEAMADEWMP